MVKMVNFMLTYIYITIKELMKKIREKVNISAKRHHPNLQTTNHVYYKVLRGNKSGFSIHHSNTSNTKKTDTSSI